MAKKKVSIDYTSKDFNSIKKSLIDYAQRYYPEVYQDFNEASFGLGISRSILSPDEIFFEGLIMILLFNFSFSFKIKFLIELMIEG